MLLIKYNIYPGVPHLLVSYLAFPFETLRSDKPKSPILIRQVEIFLSVMRILSSLRSLCTMFLICISFNASKSYKNI